MKIAIFGASGGVGQQLLAMALEGGHRVTAAVRHPGSVAFVHQRLQVVRCDVRDPGAVWSALLGQDAVLCALGGPRHRVTLYSEAALNIVAGMKIVGVKRIVFLSNFGVLGERGKGWISAPWVAMAKVMLADTLRDHALAIETLRASGLEWTAVRPMALTDGPWTGSYRTSITGLPPGGRSISRADVADMMLRCTESGDFVNQTPAIAY